MINSGTPLLLQDIEASALVLERVPSKDWPTAVVGAGLGDFKAAERHLQGLLARYPDVLPFASFSSTFHPSVCIGREVPTDAGPIDCMYLSGQGRVTLVETKLFKNPEARRHVVAQLLDYCVHASRFRFGDVESIARNFAEREFPEYRFAGLREYVVWRLQANPYQPSVSLAEPNWVLTDEHFDDQVAHSLRRGEMLALIVGDRIDPRVTELSQFANARAGLALELGVVELAFHRPRGQRTPILVIPRVIQQAVPIQRVVVDVRVDAEGAVKVDVAPVTESASAITGARTPQLASRLEFMEVVKSRAPESARALGELFDKMQRIAEASNGVIALDFGAATANLYWQVDLERRFRFFALEAHSGGRLAVWSGYLRNAGYDSLAGKLEARAEGIVTFTPNKQSGAVSVTEDNVQTLLDLLDDLTAIVLKEPRNEIG